MTIGYWQKYYFEIPEKDDCFKNWNLKKVEEDEEFGTKIYWAYYVQEFSLQSFEAFQGGLTTKEMLSEDEYAIVENLLCDVVNGSIVTEDTIQLGEKFIYETTDVGFVYVNSFLWFCNDLIAKAIGFNDAEDFFQQRSNKIKWH